MDILHSTMNSQGCGFGALEKPIEERCEKMHTDPHIENGAECVFFCVNPRLCRGAVGYTTGALPRKPAGSFSFMIFLTPRPPISVAVIFIRTKGKYGGCRCNRISGIFLVIKLREKFTTFFLFYTCSVDVGVLRLICGIYM